MGKVGCLKLKERGELVTVLVMKHVRSLVANGFSCNVRQEAHDTSPTTSPGEGRGKGIAAGESGETGDSLSCCREKGFLVWLRDIGDAKMEMRRMRNRRGWTTNRGYLP